MTVINNNLKEFLDLKPNDKIAIFGYLSSYQIDSKILGDSVTYEFLIDDLKKSLVSVDYFSFQDFGITGKLLTKIWNRKNKSHLGSNKDSFHNFKFMTTAISLIGLHIISKIDLLFYIEVKRVINQHDKILIFSPWIFFSYISSKRKTQMKQVYLFQVNNEFKHTEFHIRYISKTIFRKLILKMVFFIESTAISASAGVITVAKRDMESIKRLYGAKKIMAYRMRVPCEPLPSLYSTNAQFIVFDINRNFKINLNDSSKRIKILFLGSKSPINKNATDKILSYAKEFEKIIFIIVGKVGDYYKDVSQLPTNFIITGYLDNIARIIPFIDYFILFDLMETGLEVKAYEYAKFNLFTLIIGNNTSDEYEDIFNKNFIVFKDDEKVKEFLNLTSNKRS